MAKGFNKKQYLCKQKFNGKTILWHKKMYSRRS